MTDETPQEKTSVATGGQNLGPVVDALDFLLETELKRARDPSRPWERGDDDERIAKLRSRLRSLQTT